MKRPLAKIAAAFLVFVLATGTATQAQVQTLTVLYSFTNSPDGSFPEAGLIMDAAGNLYSTTSSGGIFGFGTVFKLDPSGNETVLHNFTGGGDGRTPAAGLIMDTAGNLYGTTSGGGASGNCGGGCGTVFKLDTSGNETVLHSFTGSPGDGRGPVAGLIMDAAGNIYGTTESGGGSSNCFLGCGTVFKLDASGVETVLYSFTGGGDGGTPVAGLIMDAAGNLYGTTVFGGFGFGGGSGTVFKLDPSGDETVLHSFTGFPDGADPRAGLVMDAAGNVYGTTQGGGASKAGTVFKLDPSGNETVLHNFTFSGGDGGFPFAGLVMDATGNLYGTTAAAPFPAIAMAWDVESSSSSTPPATRRCCTPSQAAMGPGLAEV